MRATVRRAATLPNANGAEENLVGALFLRPEQTDRVLELVRPADLTNPRARLVLEAMAELRRDGAPVDMVTVREKLADGGTIMAASSLADMVTDVASAENLEHHARLIRSRAVQRELVHLADQLKQSALVDDDVAELLARAHRSLEDLGQRLPAARDMSQALTRPVRELLGDDDEGVDDVDTDWLVDELLPAGTVTFLAGEPKTRKTWVALYLAVCVASGRALFDRFPCKRGPVVVVTEEDTPKEFRKRMWWLARGIGCDPRTLPIRGAVLKGIRLDDPAALEQLEQECKGASLVVLDALTRFHQADENDRTAMQTVTMALQRLAGRTGATVLAIHHLRKKGQGDEGVRPGQRMRGTGDLHALARAVIGVSVKDDALELSPESNYGEPVDPFTVKLDTQPRDDGKLEARFEFVGGYDDTDENKLLSLMSPLRDPKTMRELRKEFGGRGSKVDKLVKRLAQKGLIEPCESSQADSRGRKIPFIGWRRCVPC